MMKLNSYKFSELYEMSSGISTKPEQAGHGYPFLSFSTIFKNYYLPFELHDLMNTSERERKFFSIKSGDIFLTRTSETLNELAMSSVALKDYPNATYSGFSKRLRPIQKNKTYDKYMAFFLRSPYFRKIIDNNAIMTLRASFNENIFSYLNILLPKYEEQKKIGDYLYNLSSISDTCIDINRKYHAIIDLYYRYYLVKFANTSEAKKYDSKIKKEIPVSWKTIKLKDLCSIKSGFAFKTESYCKNGKYRLLTIKNVQDKYIDMNVDNYINILDKNIPDYCYLKDGDMLISLTGNVGRIGLVYEKDCLLNQRVGIIIPNNPDLKSYIYTLFQSNWLMKKIEKISTGTSQKNVSPIDIENIYVPYPNNDVIDLFKAINIINDCIVSNFKESHYIRTYIENNLQLFINGQIKMQ